MKNPLNCFVDDIPLSDIFSSFLEGRRDGNSSKWCSSDWRILLSSKEIQFLVKQVALIMNEKFEGQEVVLVGILNGVFIFLSDLVKRLQFDYSVYFVELSSYEMAEKSGDVKVKSVFDVDRLKNKKICLLDELFDSGKTMNKLRDLVIESGIPEDDITTCTLFAKVKACCKYPYPEIVGIRDLPDWWVMGYGLDDAGLKRGWKHLLCKRVTTTVGLSGEEKDGFEKARSFIFEQMRSYSCTKDLEN